MVSKTRTPIGAIPSSCAVSCRDRPAQATHDYEHGRDFIADLDKFLGQLPMGWPYGVEMRNRGWLKPEYFECLARHQVASHHSQNAHILSSDAYYQFAMYRLLRPG